MKEFLPAVNVSIKRKIDTLRRVWDSPEPAQFELWSNMRLIGQLETQNLRPFKAKREPIFYPDRSMLILLTLIGIALGVNEGQTLSRILSVCDIYRDTLAGIHRVV